MAWVDSPVPAGSLSVVCGSRDAAYPPRSAQEYRAGQSKNTEDL
jgi:hypothetical protein